MKLDQTNYIVWKQQIMKICNFDLENFLVDDPPPRIMTDGSVNRMFQDLE